MSEHGGIGKFVGEVVGEFLPEDPAFKESARRALLAEPVRIWERRDNEPEYAKLRLTTEGEGGSNKRSDQSSDQKSDLHSKQPSDVARALNVYDQPIDLIALVNESVPREQSLYINGNPAVGDNPDRNKQHGFYFNADNCIGCHACESACAEKNETPAHLAFRSVGYVEGGSYPGFRRLNISMACNHCDDPVCLKGCPTAAYTKHTEYGAVLQDPDTCFGCGYCTWVCPYNAPQLDPVEGQVSKCNMCVDRLEVGLKPACVSACVGNALDFGVIEEIPENRQQAKTSIPGFPDPSISRPNIRFQQTAHLPEEMTRTDSAPIKYHLDRESGVYLPGVDPKHGARKQWSIDRLSSRENPLVMFTLFVQAAIGAFAMLIMGKLFSVDALAPLMASNAYAALVLTCGLFAAVGLALSTSHLGKPQRFYRGFNNLRYSPVSREGLGVALFFGFAVLHGLLALLPWNNVLMGLLRGLTAVIAFAGGAVGLYYMVKCYRIPARPFWNHWQTATSFVGSSVSLGAILLGGFAVLASESGGAALSLAAALCALGLALELVGLHCHARDNHGAQHEGAASHYVQTTQFGKSYVARNVALVLLCVLCIVIAFTAAQPVASNAWLMLAAILVPLVLLVALVSRALFYVLVIPTTMPGAFFWRNKGFAEHAHQVGLSDSVASGLVSNAH